MAKITKRIIKLLNLDIINNKKEKMYVCQFRHAAKVNLLIVLPDILKKSIKYTKL